MRPALFLAASLAALPASADDLIEQARALSADGPRYAYELRYEDDELVALGTVDPSEPEGQRIVVTAPPRTEWPDGFADALKAMDRRSDGNIWCSRLMARVPENPVRTAARDGSATYTFTPKPEDNTSTQEEKLLRKAIGTVVLDTVDGAVKSFQIHLPEPAKPHYLAKVTDFSWFVTCERAPDGRTYAADFRMQVAGSAMGRSFSQRMVRSIPTLLRPVD